MYFVDPSNIHQIYRYLKNRSTIFFFYVLIVTINILLKTWKIKKGWMVPNLIIRRPVKEVVEATWGWAV